MIPQSIDVFGSTFLAIFIPLIVGCAFLLLGTGIVTAIEARAVRRYRRNKKMYVGDALRRQNVKRGAK
jgi:hypothetical protein